MDADATMSGPVLVGGGEPTPEQRPASLPRMFFGRAACWADRPRYRYRSQGKWHEVLWCECADRVRALSAVLMSLGVQEGDRVALLSETRPEWIEIDLAILSCGAVTVPIYPSSLPDECAYILWNSEAEFMFVENTAQADKIEIARREGVEVDGERVRPRVKHVLKVDSDAEDGLAALLAAGRKAWPGAKAQIDARIQNQQRDDLATIVYTSGTTGPPKGVLQTHGNHLAAVESVGQLAFVESGEVDFFFLPLAHSFARMMEYLGLYLGTVTAFARSIETLLVDLADSQPHFIPSVPRIYEKIYSRIMATRDAASPVKRALMDWAFKVGRARSGCEQAGRVVGPWLRCQVWFADRLVLGKIRSILGGRVRFVISGGAPLAREIAEFLHAVGILVLEGYGLTETTPILTVNRPDRYRFGTVGLPVPGVELRFAPDHEILARGPNIATGYYRRPEATAAVWDADGWFHTGDIGELDADGLLRITDRKKDLIKTSGGKYVAPQSVENLLKTQPHISQAVVVGDRRKYCVALISVDVEEVRAWAKRSGVTLPSQDDWAASRELLALIDSEVAAANEKLPSYSTVKYFRLLPRDLSQESGELTPSLKVKRKVVAERYDELIQEMYV